MFGSALLVRSLKKKQNARWDQEMETDQDTKITTVVAESSNKDLENEDEDGHLCPKTDYFLKTSTVVGQFLRKEMETKIVESSCDEDDNQCPEGCGQLISRYILMCFSGNSFLPVPLIYHTP